MADFPTTGGDVIFGTGAGETIDALEGNDTIFGSAGNDTLRGNSGDDLLSGGLGLDALIGGRFGSDTAYYALAFDSVIASLELGYGYVGAGNQAVDKDSFHGIENIEGGLGGDQLTGNEYANRLDGNRGKDEILGQGGGDTIDGGAGDDWLEGRTGDDLVQGGSGADRADGGDGEDTVKGGAGADLVDGGYGRDALSGGTGGDWLYGGPDADRMSGGQGADTFFYQVGDDLTDPQFRDLIVDYEPGIDRIVFSAQQSGVVPVYIGNLHFDPEGEGQVRSFVKDGRTFVHYLEFGDGPPDIVVVLKGIHTLSQDDF